MKEKKITHLVMDQPERVSVGGQIDNLLNGLTGSNGNHSLKKRGAIKIKAPQFTKGGRLTGRRSKASIMRIVMRNLPALRYAYNRRLRVKPGLKGKIVVKFVIDAYGRVLSCDITESTTADPELEKTVIKKITLWRFPEIDKSGDITEVVYPFVFSQ